MWPFGRKAEATPAATGPQPVPVPAIRRDWMGLPPIQRLIGEHPLTAPSERFSDDLATHQDPSLSTGTMGHQVSAEAPAGMVLALARPSTRSDGPAMVPRPRVQRRVDGAVTESGEWDGDEAVAVETRPSPLPASTPAVAARELPVVAPEPVAQRLVSLPPDGAPIPIAPTPKRSRPTSTPFALSPSINEPSEPPPAPRLTLGQSRRMGLGAPIKRVPDRSVQRTAGESIEAPGPPTAVPASLEPAPTPHAPAPTPESSNVIARTLDRAMPVPAPEPVPRVTAPEPDLRVAPSSPANLRDEPRLDLPLTRRLAANESSAQRTLLVDDTPVTAPALPFGTTPASPKASNDPSTESPKSSNEPSPVPPEPTNDLSSPSPAVVQRLAEGTLPLRSSSKSGQTPEVDSPPTAAAAASLAPSSLAPASAATYPADRRAAPASVPGAIAPLVGARPLRPSVTVQRSSDTSPRPPENQVVHSPRPESAAAPGRRGTESAPTSGWFDARAFTEDEPATMSFVPTPLRHDPAHVLPVDEAGPVVQAYHPAGATLSEASTEMSHADAPAQAARENRLSRSLGLPLAPQPGVALQRAAQALTDSRIEPVDAPAEPYGPTLQGARYDSIAAGAGSLASSATSSSGVAAEGGAVGSAIGAAAASSGHQQGAGPDLDELAGKLYDRIRTRLKTELLIDRERAGFLTDLR